MPESPIHKRQQLSLGEYVEYRNGLPLGASGSLQNMLVRSLGAGTFAKFWQYWNPIWGYALGRYIYAPLNRFLPASLALIFTFAVSGAIHDAVIMLVRGAPAFLFTPWFILMSGIVVLGRLVKLDYSQQAFSVRVAINLFFVIGCLMMVYYLS
jgi:hypothetical protein